MSRRKRKSRAKSQQAAPSPVPPSVATNRRWPLLLVAGGGFKTVEIDVSHRARVAGISKYGVWNRLGRGIYDLIGVAWFQKRRLRNVSSSELRS